MMCQRCPTFMTEIKSRSILYLKAALFLVIGGVSFALLLLQNPTFQTALLLGLVIWSFCRAYYFAFYVIEHYIDAKQRYAGLFDFVRRHFTR